MKPHRVALQSANGIPYVFESNSANGQPGADSQPKPFRARCPRSRPVCVQRCGRKDGGLSDSLNLRLVTRGCAECCAGMLRPALAPRKCVGVWLMQAARPSPSLPVPGTQRRGAPSPTHACVSRTPNHTVRRAVECGLPAMLPGARTWRSKAQLRGLQACSLGNSSALGAPSREYTAQMAFGQTLLPAAAVPVDRSPSVASAAVTLRALSSDCC